MGVGVKQRSLEFIQLPDWKHFRRHDGTDHRTVFEVLRPSQTDVRSEPQRYPSENEEGNPYSMGRNCLPNQQWHSQPSTKESVCRYHEFMLRKYFVSSPMTESSECPHRLIYTKLAGHCIAFVATPLYRIPSRTSFTDGSSENEIPNSTSWYLVELPILRLAAL